MPASACWCGVLWPVDSSAASIAGKIRKATVDVFKSGPNAKAPWAPAAIKAMDAMAVRQAHHAGVTGVEYQNFLDRMRL